MATKGIGAPGNLNPMKHNRQPSPHMAFLKLLPIAAILAICAVCQSCSSPKTLTFTCQERHIEIYVNDQYLGRDMVSYTVPKGRNYIEVSGRDKGMEVYHRRIDVKNLNATLVELQIPKNYKYSSKPY